MFKIILFQKLADWVMQSFCHTISLHHHHQIKLWVSPPITQHPTIVWTLKPRDNCSIDFQTGGRGLFVSLFQFRKIWTREEHADGVPTPKMRKDHASCVRSWWLMWRVEVCMYMCVHAPVYECVILVDAGVYGGGGNWWSLWGLGGWWFGNRQPSGPRGACCARGPPVCSGISRVVTSFEFLFKIWNY